MASDKENEANRTVTISVEYWKALLQMAGRQIDPETAEVYWEHTQVLDPYGVFDIPAEFDCVGRSYFARSPGSKIWVTFSDLPKETRDALRAKHARSPFR
jgi:hypothetical protein